MADCGATGSTLDRAAAAVVGSSRGGTAKHVASFLGNASMGTTTNNMPSAPPVMLAVPSSSAARMAAPSMQQQHHHNIMDGAWQQQQQQPIPMQHHAPHQHHHMPVVPHHHHHVAQQQQQHHAMMMMAHHQQMQQQMQQQMMQLNYLKQQQQQKALSETKSAGYPCAEQVRASPPCQGFSRANRKQPFVKQDTDNLDAWHEGLEAEVQAELENHDDDVVTVGEEQEENADHHEGQVQGVSMEELAKAWAQALDEPTELDGQQESTTVDASHNEGEVQGASIEELAKAWSKAEAEYNQEQAETSSNLWTGLESDVVQQHHHQYEFSDASQQHPREESHDYMAEGMQYFKEGRTTEAIASFETLLRHIDADNATAWLMLGRCHAENDEDRKAIACLEQAVEKDPYCTEALLNLGVSYVNELNHELALVSLKNWITHNPSYAGMELSGIQGETPLDEVQRLLKSALEFDDAHASQVQEALGVVYNVSRDYDAAVSSFRQALETNPSNYQLWNKLGATLANSHQSDEALGAYEKALQLKPRYARAWLNMAISHSNLHNYEDAARCYLQTLSLNPAATHCWSYLRIALSCLEQWDLIPHAASQDLDAFREYYEFV